MKTIKELNAEIYTILYEISEQRNKAIKVIIEKIYNHPIALNDAQHDFLKEIEADLREFQRTCC